jgi:hypothetical protein
MQPDRQFSFARYTVDLDNAQLWRGKLAIALTSQTFAVLRYLDEHAGQVVTTTELFAALARYGGERWRLDVLYRGDPKALSTVRSNYAASCVGGGALNLANSLVLV